MDTQVEVKNFDPIAKQYTPMIYKIITRLNIYKNRDKFFQTGLIALWDAYKNFDEAKGNFSSYAYSYIKGRIMTELTKARKQEERSVYPDEVYSDTIQDKQTEPPLEAEFLQSICAELTDKEMKWVFYTSLNDFSVNEIGKREHVTVSAVKQWRSNAKRKLKKVA
ncbi:sigma-70 family RNA polymerase sigma factor [Bacillota bacterium Lsc_1132]